MKTATITVKVKPEIKKQAKQVADDLGFNLSSLVNAYLADLIRNRRVYFDGRPEIPNEYFKQALQESQQDYRNDDSISFDNADDAIAYLEDTIKEDEHEN